MQRKALEPRLTSLVKVTAVFLVKGAEATAVTQRHH